MIARFAAAIRALRYAGTVAAENLVLRREVEQALCALGREHLDALHARHARAALGAEEVVLRKRVRALESDLAAALAELPDRRSHVLRGLRRAE